MKRLRRLRKRLTVSALELGRRLAEDGNVRNVERMGEVLRMLSKTALPIRKRLKTNIRCAGLYYDGLIDDYFELAIEQLMMLAHVLRAGLPESGCMEKFRFDDSFGILKNAYEKGKGVINIAPHICGYPLYGGIVSSRIPCVMYMRQNKDTRKMKLTRTVARAGEGEVIYPPEGATKSRRLKVAIDILRQGRMMFITPDTPRKPHEGVPVKILGKRTYFPVGVFVMSLRTGAPVVPTWWHRHNGIYHIRYSEPFELKRGGNLNAKAEQATKKWADDVDKFIRKYPQMWWNWLDKRWTHILRNQGL